MSPPDDTPRADVDRRTESPVIQGGTVWLLRVMDVADFVDLERARAATLERGAQRVATEVRGPEKGPAGVVLHTPPLALDMGTVSVDGLSLRASIRVFDFGAVSVRFALDLEPGTTPLELAQLAARIDRLGGLDAAARDIWNRLAPELAAAVRAPHPPDLVEDYLVFEITRLTRCATAREALQALDPARILLAEPERQLAADMAQTHVSRALQYYADDAAIVGWNAALVLDPDRARDELAVLEIATARLLELRYYDRLVARELAGVYDALQLARLSSTLFRSPFVAVTRRAATLYVEMTDLYDRVEGAITLVGDAYTARLYREAAERFRLESFSSAVREKINTLARVSEVFQAEIAHRRTLVLEVAVVVLIVFELLLTILRR